ncbi:MAG: DUF3987 domain-containing protein [Candidatus Saccharibacteria bacterium]|nr:DUF3987 domain-containing protein [Moraxellaceae bacterium]
MLTNLKARLKIHLSQKPVRPKKAILLFNNTTPEAILLRLNKDTTSGGLCSAEGGQILNGRAAEQLPMLDTLWDGGSVNVDRVGSESFVVKDVRLTIGTMTQPKTFDKFTEGRGLLARDNGFLGRTLMTHPPSTQGLRAIASIEELLWPKLETFQKRMTELLEKAKIMARDPAFKREMLEFSLDAKVIWVDFANYIELNLNEGRCYADVRDAASKIAENVARMAALFHFFEGRTGKIQRDTVEQAIIICEWYLKEFQRIFSTPKISLEQKEAQLLLRWLYDFLWRTGKTFVRKNDVLKFGPNGLRNKITLDRALDILIRDRIIWIAVDDKKAKYVNLNEQYFQYYNPSPLH